MHLERAYCVWSILWLYRPLHRKTSAILKSKSNKAKLASVLGTFNLGEITTGEAGDGGTFCHD